MTVAEILKQMVETESKDERMSIVESNKEMLSIGDKDIGALEEQLQWQKDDAMRIQGELEVTQTNLDEQKQKYIDTFFNSDPEETDKTETTDKSEESEKSLSDIENEINNS